MSRMFLWFIKKIESFFRLYPIYHRSAIRIAGCWSVTDRWYKDPLRRGADAKCINRNGVRGAQRPDDSISLATFWGRWSSRGFDISFIDFFFYISALLFLYNPTSFIQQTAADLFRLVIDCSRDFVGGFHPTSYDTTISSAVYFYGGWLERMRDSFLQPLFITGWIQYVWEIYHGLVF